MTGSVRVRFPKYLLPYYCNKPKGAKSEKQNKDFKVVVIGRPDISKMSESEQKTFYVALLKLILEKHKQQLENE